MVSLSLAADTVHDGGGFTLQGATDLVDALTDADDYGYGYAVSGTAILGLTSGASALPEGAVITQTRVTCRGRGYAGQSSPWTIAVYLRNSDGTTTYSSTTDSYGGTVSWLSKTGTYGTSTRPSSQSDIDNLRLYVTLTRSQVTAAAANVTYVPRPVVTPTPIDPDPTSNTTPTFSWTRTLDGDGGAQSRYEIKVFTDAVYLGGGFDPATSSPYWTSGEVASSVLTTTLGTLALGDTYRAYIRIAQTVNAASHWSLWAYDEFTAGEVHPITASGSVTTDGTANITIPRELTASGSTTTTGSAAILVKRPITATGSTTTTGSAAINVRRPLTASGSTTTTGSATLVVKRPITSTGSVTITGTANIIATRPMSASGSLTTTGTAALRQSHSLTFSSAIADTFTRADSITTMGSTETGQAWVAQGGSVWGIDTGRAYCVTSGADLQNHVLVETGLSDCTIEATIGVAGDGGIAFRAIDNDNLFVSDVALSEIIYRRTGGGQNFVNVCSLSQSFVAGDVQKIVMTGSFIEIFRNGTSVGSFTDTQGQTATKHGFRVYDAARSMRLDNFSVSAGAGGGENKVTVTGAATLQIKHGLTASGAATTTGTAAFRVKHALASTGAVTTTGTANITIPRLLTATGSVTITGSASIATARPLTSTGTTTTTGSASILAQRPITASGSVTTTGSAVINVRRPITASGAATTTGTATINVARPLTATGATTTTGSAIIGQPLWVTSTGATTITGSASILVHRPITATGTTTITGTATPKLVLALTASGTTTITASAAWDVPPQVPLNLVATPVSDTEIDLTWDDNVFNAIAWDIMRDGTFIEFDWPLTTYSDTGLDPLTEYDYRVRAVI